MNNLDYYYGIKKSSLLKRSYMSTIEIGVRGDDKILELDSFVNTLIISDDERILDSSILFKIFSDRILLSERKVIFLIYQIHIHYKKDKNHVYDCFNEENYQQVMNSEDHRFVYSFLTDKNTLSVDLRLEKLNFEGLASYLSQDQFTRYKLSSIGTLMVNDQKWNYYDYKENYNLYLRAKKSIFEALSLLDVILKEYSLNTYYLYFSRKEIRDIAVLFYNACHNEIVYKTRVKYLKEQYKLTDKQIEHLIDMIKENKEFNTIYDPSSSFEYLSPATIVKIEHICKAKMENKTFEELIVYYDNFKPIETYKLNALIFYGKGDIYYEEIEPLVQLGVKKDYYHNLDFRKIFLQRITSRSCISYLIIALRNLNCKTEKRSLINRLNRIGFEFDND